MEFDIIKRQALIIWLYSTKQIRDLRKHGYVHYYSRKMKYAIMYVEKEEAEEIKDILNNYFFVRDVEYSYRDDIDMTFENAIEHSEEKSLLSPFEEVIDNDALIQSIADSIRQSKINNE